MTQGHVYKPLLIHAPDGDDVHISRHVNQQTARLQHVGGVVRHQCRHVLGAQRVHVALDHICSAAWLGKSQHTASSAAQTPSLTPDELSRVLGHRRVLCAEDPHLPVREECHSHDEGLHHGRAPAVQREGDVGQHLPLLQRLDLVRARTVHLGRQRGQHFRLELGCACA